MTKYAPMLALSAGLCVGAVPALSAEFFAIGTGGPTGVYFQVGNAVCQMVHKEAAEGRSSGSEQAKVSITKELLVSLEQDEFRYKLN